MVRTPMLMLSVLTVAAFALAVPPQAAHAAGEPPESAPVQLATGDGEDRRVEVQLVVLGLAAFVVVGVGGAAYLLRKRLGMIPPPPPEQDAGGHH